MLNGAPLCAFGFNTVFSSLLGKSGSLGGVISEVLQIWWGQKDLVKCLGCNNCSASYKIRIALVLTFYVRCWDEAETLAARQETTVDRQGW